MSPLARFSSSLAAAAAVAALAPASGLARPSIGVSCSTSAKVVLAGKPLDLTGKWEAGLGIYYLRQLGNCVFWSAHSVPTGNWAHVFLGKITGATLSGVWSDVPSARIQSSGTLQLKIDVSGRTLTRTSQAGGFGDANWTKSS